MPIIAGMIDTHAYVCERVTGKFGLNADRVGVQSATTTLVDCDCVASAVAVAPGCRESAFAPIDSRTEKTTHSSLHGYRRARRPHGAFRGSNQDHPGVQAEHVPSHRLEVRAAALSLL